MTQDEEERECCAHDCVNSEEEMRCAYHYTPRAKESGVIVIKVGGRKKSA